MVPKISSAELLAHIDKIFLMISLSQWDAINEVLKLDNISELSNEYLVGLLRCTGNYKHRLSNYTKALDKVFKELDKRGHKPKEILQGLF